MISRNIGRMKTKSTVFLVALALSLIMSGCSSVSYYTQSVVGHSRLMLARTSLDNAIKRASEDNNTLLVEQLTLARQLRDFAVSELGLPDNRSYKSYVALEREFPVWAVVAAPEFSLAPRQWCYPVIGCASYRGYFKKAAADHYVDKLQQQGFETSLGGVGAYSTLGWFADPVLPSMLRYGNVDFAETMFHELAHQQLYINGDSAFNEAFATVVGEHGAVRWLSITAPEKLLAYSQLLSARNDFNQLLESIKTELTSVYQEELPVDQKRAAKLAVYKRLQMQYAELKQQRWDGKQWFDRWFEKPINNARLAAFATYRSQVPALQSLLAECDGDLFKFYDVLSNVTKVDGAVELPERC